MNSIPTVGFVGLGSMGWPMARNVVAAGLPALVADSDPCRRDAFAKEHGCERAAGPADFASADIVVTMLPTGQIVRDVMLEAAGGIAAALRPGSVLIDMSSSDPTGTRSLGDDLRARGLRIVDAPVSGGVAKAADGTLSIMLGADDVSTIERVLPVIETMSARVFRTGPLGSGHATKALNNYVAAAGFTAAAEALVVGEKFGLDPAALVDVLNASTGKNFSTEYTFKEHVLTRTFATGFSLGLMSKDVDLAAGLAEAMDVSAPLCEAVAGRLSDALDAVDGADDHSLAYKLWADRAVR